VREDGIVAVRSAQEPDGLRLAAALRDAYREATVVLTRALSHNRLSQLEYHLLLDLAGSGDGLGQSQLTDHLQAPKTRVSIMVRALERRGLVEPFRPDHDRRQVRVRLTPEGRERLETAQLAVRHAMCELVAGFPQGQLVVLLEGALRTYLGLDVTVTMGPKQLAPRSATAARRSAAAPRPLRTGRRP
jgi:DNA-binding MarR family transcriptional regulator